MSELEQDVIQDQAPAQKPPAEPAQQAGAKPTDAKPETIAGDAGAQDSDAGTEPAEGQDGDATLAGEAATPALELNVPEGVEVDQATLDSVLEFAKSSGLDSEKAQWILDRQIEALKAGAEQVEKSLLERSQKWRAVAEADPEISGQMQKVKDRIGRAVKQFGSKELLEVLNDPALGVGNHPAVVKFLAAVGASLEEDSVGGSLGGGASVGDPLARLYPSMFKG